MLTLQSRLDLFIVTSRSPWPARSVVAAEAALASHVRPDRDGGVVYETISEYPDFVPEAARVPCLFCPGRRHRHRRDWLDLAAGPYPRQAAAQARWLRRAARGVLATEVNSELQGQLDLVLGAARGLWLEPRPRDLLRAIYVRLALHTVGTDRTEMRECANPRCREGRFFVPTRRDQRYCGTRCRDVDGYHRRKARAVERIDP